MRLLFDQRSGAAASWRGARAASDSIPFLVLLVTLLLTSCSGSGGNSGSSTDDFSYLALGDSYTIGQSVERNETYPVQLGGSLLADARMDIRIFAQTGWTTEDLAIALDARTDFRDSYDLVSLLIGVNNQYQARSLENYRIEFRDLLERAIEFAGNNPGRVFVVSIPDYAYTPFGGGDPAISQEIDAFNAANKSITDEYGIQYFDVTPISREGLNEPELVASDGLHPSGEQYRRWVALMVDDVRRMLN